MRNSASQHNQAVPPGLLAVLLLLLLRPCSLSGEQEFNISSEDMVAIHADKAWEDIEPDTVHFTGNFEMRVRDLRLTADRATLYGKLDDPDRLVLEGSPARLSLSHTQGDRMHAIQAEALQIVYEREPALMRLTGAARLAQDENVLLSHNIEYDIRTDRFRTRGKTGVQINVHPEQ